jgi:hypothetical protein
MQRAAAMDWVHRPEEFASVQSLLCSAVPLLGEHPPVLAAVEFRDFELLRYGVGAFFAEHADRCGCVLEPHCSLHPRSVLSERTGVRGVAGGRQ